MALRQEILDYTNAILNIGAFQDYCPNGLQVEGKPEVKKLISGVTACQALLDAAIEQKADMILVHHGYFWRGESPAIVGIKHRRIKTLIENDINLLAYHLPLDAHSELGNNVQLAEKLAIKIDGALQPYDEHPIGIWGHLDKPMAPQDFAQHLEEKLFHKPLHIESDKAFIESVGWCTGAAEGMIEQAHSLGLDAYISGEISEQTTHQARELGIHYYASGHHATEKYGVQALGEHLAAKFKLEHQFIDIPNPV